MQAGPDNKASTHASTSTTTILKNGNTPLSPSINVTKADKKNESSRPRILLMGPRRLVINVISMENTTQEVHIIS